MLRTTLGLAVVLGGILSACAGKTGHDEPPDGGASSAGLGGPVALPLVAA